MSWIKNKIAVATNKPVTQKYSNYYLTKESIFKTLDGKNQFVFLGDSITNHENWNELFNNNNIVNRGIDSDTTDGVLNRLNTIIKSQPQKLFLMIGINDLGNGRNSTYIINNYEKIISQVRKKSPNTIIYIQSILPVNEQMINSKTISNKEILQTNEKLKQLVNDKIVFINLFDLFLSKDNQLDKNYTFDGEHPNGTAYLIWKQAIERYVNSQ
jgi:lysophospholipase L1-like esterase